MSGEFVFDGCCGHSWAGCGSGVDDSVFGYEVVEYGEYFAFAEASVAYGYHVGVSALVVDSVGFGWCAYGGDDCGFDEFVVFDDVGEYVFSEVCG